MIISNKFIKLFTVISLCIAITACARKAEPPASEAPPSIVPDAASIIEPIEIVGSEPEIETEIIIEPEPEIAPPAVKASSLEEVSPKAESRPTVKSPAPNVDEASVPDLPNAPDIPSAFAASSSDAGLLHKVAPDKKLNVESIERELLRLINELRDQVGVSGLGIEDSMQFASRIRAAEALKSFSHTRTDGTPYNTAFDEAGFSYAGKWHGENLASLQFTEGMFDEKATALEMFKGLKNSPGHYQNMVGENFVQVGVGVSISYGGGLVNIASAQLFSSL